MPKRTVYDEAQARADAELALRRRREESSLRAIYDWYGLSCPCNLPPGKCRIHPRARLKQRPPGTPGSPWPDDYPWSVFLMQAGRSGGKTFGAAQFVRWKIERGDWKQVVIVGATIGDVRNYQVHGRSGLVTISPPWCRAKFIPSWSMVRYPELDAEVHLVSSEEPETLRGGNMDGAWCDEIGKWKYQDRTYAQVEMVLRNPTMPPPQNIISGTPTATPVVIRLNREADKEEEKPRSTGTLRVSWATEENREHVSGEWLDKRQEQYRGTLEGEQELGGRLVLRKEGALWGPEDFLKEHFLIDTIPEDLKYVGVGVDPSTGGDDKKRAAETGIIVGARRRSARGSYLSRGVILDDYSSTGKPDDWGFAVVRAYYDWMANEVVAEKNQGGEMVRHVIQNVPAKDGYPSGKDVPVRLIWAGNSKIVRAEPVQMIYAGGRMQHYRMSDLATLELQMVQYIPGKSGQKLDRVDALVHIMTRAILEHDRIGDPGSILVGPGGTDFHLIGDPNLWRPE